MNNIDGLLERLHLEAKGKYDNHFYIIPIESSDEYAKIYSRLDKYAINTEFPEITKTDKDIITNIVNYFEYMLDETKYALFLMADFINDKYKLKIKESDQ